MKDVALARLDLVEVVALHHLTQDDEAADDHRRPRRLEAPYSSALGERKRSEVREYPFDGPA